MRLLLLCLILFPFISIFSEVAVYDLQYEIEHAWIPKEISFSNFENISWKKAKGKKQKFFSSKDNYHLLLRIKLPKAKFRDPTLYLQTVYQNFEVYTVEKKYTTRAL
ncbi:MAG: hypothetical protein H7A25_12970 [Leptospiraceae bacterium]|nr:hypothetical protein [Leptospiraceae bacterium]